MNKPKISKNLFIRIHNVNILKRKRDNMNVVDALHLNQVCSKIDILSNYIKNDLDSIVGFFCENFPNEVFTVGNVFNFVRERVSNDLLTFEERQEVLSEISYYLERNKSLMFVMDNSSASGKNGFIRSKCFITHYL